MKCFTRSMLWFRLTEKYYREHPCTIWQIIYDDNCNGKTVIKDCIKCKCYTDEYIRKFCR